MARPRKDDDERRSDCFTIRLTPAERLALSAEAARLRLSPTELARQRLIRGRVVVRQHRQPDPRLVFELGKIGVNLNQIARALNSDQKLNPATIEAALDELRPVIARLMLEDAQAGALPDDPAPTRPGTAPNSPLRNKPRAGGSG